MLGDRSIKQSLWSVGSTSLWCSCRFCSSSLDGNNQLGSKRERRNIMISYERSSYGADWSVNHVWVRMWKMHGWTLEGLSEHLYSWDAYVCRNWLYCSAERGGGGGDGGFLVFPQWKTNADKPQQHGEVTSEMLASIDGPVLFQASVSHSMAQCTREHGIHNPNKTKQCAR